MADEILLETKTIAYVLSFLTQQPITNHERAYPDDYYNQVLDNFLAFKIPEDEDETKEGENATVRDSFKDKYNEVLPFVVAINNDFGYEFINVKAILKDIQLDIKMWTPFTFLAEEINEQITNNTMNKLSNNVKTILQAYNGDNNNICKVVANLIHYLSSENPAEEEENKNKKRYSRPK